MSADLDKAIDGAVCEMLDVEPRADLRARVVARIDAVDGVQRPASSRRLPAFSVQRFAAVSVVAALAVLGLVLGLARRVEPPAQAPVVARAGSQRTAPTMSNARPPVQRAAPIDVPAAPAQPRVARAARPTVVAAATTRPNEQSTPIEPLSAITPIDVAPIAPSSIAPDPIAVRPLTPITEMQIAPLNPPDRRD